MKLSFLIPVYNESRTLPELLERLGQMKFPGVETETIFVDDASTDGSDRILKDFSANRPMVRVIRHEKNLGKGAAVRTALKYAQGEIVVIQDADLEYDPADLPALLKPILDGEANVVFGSRNLSPNPRYSLMYYWGNFLLNLCVFLLYGRRITDMETCYKMMRRSVFLDLDIQSGRFDIEPEITAKLLRLGHKIVEVPIRYSPRSRSEGKKITWRDGLMALWKLLYWRCLKVR